MAGYAKLFHSIVHSTIWREEDHIRLVWITMLAIADKNGFVEASVPGLADISRVTLEECQSALERLSSPDEYSRSQDYEGRRIEPMDGGWLLLNYTKYRGAIMEEKIREQNRIRQKRFRRKQKADRNANVTGNADVTPVNGCNAQSDPDPTPDPSTYLAEINSAKNNKDLTLDLNNKKSQGSLSATNVSSLVSSKQKKGRPEAKSTPVWNAYAAAYRKRYGVEPKRNQKANIHCCQIVDRLGAEEAPLVAAYYLSSRNAYHVGRGHSLQALVGDCEKIRTEWATGRQITQAKAREEDRLEKARSGWQKIIDECEDDEPIIAEVVERSES